MSGVSSVSNQKKKATISQPLSMEQTEPNLNDCLHVTRNMSEEKLDTEAFIRNIWLFIFQFTNSQTAKYDQPALLLLVQEATKVLIAEPTLIELKGKVSIMGDLHGHGDSLVTLLCLNGIPPQERYIFLGSFSGLGFAPHETLFLLLALKVRYPQHVYLIKGSGEDPEVLTAQDFVVGLRKRGVTDVVWKELLLCLNALPLAVLLDNRFLCVHGGIGPQLFKNGLKALRNVPRPPKTLRDIAITMECQWSCFRYSSLIGDGSPFFGEFEVDRFCQKNNLQMIVRSRQLVVDGVLNFPERLLTIYSAACFLDNFHNAGAVVKLDTSARTASIIRYRVAEDEPKSLDDYRPPGGRNSRAM